MTDEHTGPNESGSSENELIRSLSDLAPELLEGLQGLSAEFVQRLSRLPAASLDALLHLPMARLESLSEASDAALEWLGRLAGHGGSLNAEAVRLYAELLATSPSAMDQIRQLPAETIRLLATLPQDVVTSLTQLPPELLKELPGVLRSSGTTIDEISPDDVSTQLAQTIDEVPSSLMATLDDLSPEALSTLSQVEADSLATLSEIDAATATTLAQIPPELLDSMASMPPGMLSTVLDLSVCDSTQFGDFSDVIDELASEETRTTSPPLPRTTFIRLGQVGDGGMLGRLIQQARSFRELQGSDAQDTLSEGADMAADEKFEGDTDAGEPSGADSDSFDETIQSDDWSAEGLSVFEDEEGEHEAGRETGDFSEVLDPEGLSDVQLKPEELGNPDVDDSDDAMATIQDPQLHDALAAEEDDASNAQTVVTDDFVDPSDEDFGGGADQTIQSDEFSDYSETVSDIDDESFAQTVQSDDASWSEGLSALDNSGDDDSYAQTVQSEDLGGMTMSESEDDSYAQTVQSEDLSGVTAPMEGDSYAQTMQSDEDLSFAQTLQSSDLAPDDQKTMADAWGGGFESGAEAGMTIKSDDLGGGSAKNTLVISTRKMSTRRIKDYNKGRRPPEPKEPEYELIKVLGEGGMGIVFTARQRSIDRDVALKMLKPKTAKDKEQRAKFLTEAVVTGELDHPNIVPIYDVGASPDDALFYSMKKVQGTPWLDVIKQTSVTENLDYLMRCADAVAFAHDRGVIHRDLKPENVMLGEYGEVLVMDWGLAYSTPEFNKSESITESTSMGGTPAYMAPEMATGPITKIGVHSDIYLLGAMLFEIITSRPPHAGKNAMKCLMAAARNQIREVDPEKTMKTDPTGELMEIAMKAMATKIDDRFRTVQDMQAAIREYQAHTESVTLSARAAEELKAARESDDYQDYAKSMFAYQEAYELWDGNHAAQDGANEARLAYAGSAERKGDFDLGMSLLDVSLAPHKEIYNRLSAAASERDARQARIRTMKRAGIALVGLFAVTVSGAAFWINSERTEAIKQKGIAETARDEAKRQEGIAVANEKKAVVAQQEAEKNFKEAEVQRNKAEENFKIAEEQRGRAEKNFKDAEMARMVAQQNFETAEKNRMEAEKQRMIADTKKKEAEEARDIAVKAKKQEEEARVAAVKARDEAVKAQKQEEIAKIAAVKAQKEAEKAQMEEAKARMAAVVAQKEEAKQRMIAVKAKEDEAKQRVVAEMARDAAVKAQEAEEYQAYIARIGLADAKIRENAFDAAVAILEDCPPELRNWEWGRLWHLCTQSRGSFDNGSPVDAIAVSPDGSKFVTGGWNGEAVIWEMESGKPLKKLEHNGLYVHDVAWSPDGRWIATGSNDPVNGFVQLWDAQGGARVERTFGDGSKDNSHSDAVLSVRFSKDGSRLLTSSYDNTARLWNTSTGQQVQRYLGHTWWVWDAGFSPNEEQIVTASQDGTARVWDTETGQSGAPFTGHEGPIFAVAFDAKGLNVASGGYDKRVLMWKPADVKPYDFTALASDSGRVVPAAKFTALDGHTGPVRDLAFSNDGNQLITGSQDNTVRLWDTQGTQPVKSFRGHDGAVRAVAFAGSDQMILSASHDNHIKQWSIGQYEEVRTLQSRVLEGHVDAILHAGFSPKGDRIVTASRDRTARTWEARSGTPLQVFSEGHSFLASVAVFFPDGKRMVTGAVDNTARIWDVDSGTQLKVLERSGRSAALAVSPDGNWILTGSDSKTARLWNVETGELAAELGGHNNEVTAVAFSPDGTLAVTGDSHGRAKLWDVKTRKVKFELNGHSRYRITAALFTEDGRRILTSCGDKTVAQWIAATGKEETSRILRHPDSVTGMALRPGTRQLVTVSYDKFLRVWNIDTGKELARMKLESEPNAVAIQKDGLRALTVDSDNRRVVIMRLDSVKDNAASPTEMAPERSVDVRGQLWSAAFGPSSDGLHVLTLGGSDAKMVNADSGEIVTTFSPHGVVASANYSSNGMWIVTGSWDFSARVWDAESGADLRKLAGDDGHTGFVNSAVFSPDENSQFVLTASDDRTAKLWERETGKVVRTLTGHKDRVRHAIFSPTGDRILTSSNDRTARIWNAATGELLVELKGHDWGVLSSQFSADGKRVITASEDNTARVWNAANGGELRRLEGHTARVTSAAFAPNGNRAVTASQDGSVKVWDTETEKEILTLDGHTREVTSVTFSPGSGQYLLTASVDGRAILWLASNWVKQEEAAVAPDAPAKKEQVATAK